MTDVWLQACFHEDTILDPEEPGNLLLKAMSKPLYGAFPLPPQMAEGIHISYAGFPDEPDKQHLIAFCDALGESSPALLSGSEGSQ